MFIKKINPISPRPFLNFPKLSDVLCRDSHRQSPCLFICRKTDDIQTTGDHAIDQEGDGFGGRHLGCAVCADTLEFTSVPAVDYALDECEGGPAHEEVEGVLLGGSFSGCTME